jgi:hypothetical protein
MHAARRPRVCVSMPTALSKRVIGTSSATIFVFPIDLAGPGPKEVVYTALPQEESIGREHDQGSRPRNGPVDCEYSRGSVLGIRESRSRGRNGGKPLPVLRCGRYLRFCWPDVCDWLRKSTEYVGSVRDCQCWERLPDTGTLYVEQ